MRTDYYNWHEFFFGVAFQAAMRSKDPSTQTGACIIRDNRPLGCGYNGFIRGKEDTPESWQSQEKLKYVYHAEENAIANCRIGIPGFENTSLYLWTSNPRVYLPCDRCARAIVVYGIPVIHVLIRPGSDPSKDDHRWNTSLALEIFELGNVTVVEHDAHSIHQKILSSTKEKLEL